MRHLRFALRNLLKTPVVSIVAILSLALGIGANTAIFSLFEQVLLRALPVSAPGELVNVTANGPRGGSNSTNNAGGIQSIFSYPMYRDLEKGQTVFTGLAAHRSFGANLSYQGRTASAAGMFVSGSYFGVLGVKPAVGRLLGPDDDRTPGAHRLVVLDHSYWTEKFNRDAGVINQTMLVNGTLMTVIGVSAEGFKGTTMGMGPQVYAPLSMREELTPGWKGLTERRSYWAYLFGRLKPGVSLKQAEASIDAQYLGLIREVELPLQKGGSDKYKKQFSEQKMTLVPGEQGQSGMMRQAQTPLSMMFAITGFVLLIACANIANLLLARSANRAKEFSIRLALGATRGQVIAQLLIEAMVLAVLAGFAGLLVAYGTAQAIGSFFDQGSMSGVVELGLRPISLAFAMGLSILAGFLFGLFPAIHSAKQDLSGAMKDQAGNVSGTSGAARFRRVLVTAQIALSLLLLISAGLFLQSLIKVMKVELGIRTQNVIVFGLSPDLNKYSPARAKAFYESLEKKVGAIPGVEGVSVSMVQLMAGNNYGSNVSVDGFQAGPDTDTHSMFNEVGPGFFRMMRIPMVAGREFNESDGENTPKVAVVNEAFVRKFGQGQSLIGKHMQVGAGKKNDIEIAGVAKDTRYSGVKDEAPPMFYLPYRQDKEMGSATIYVATAASTDQILPLVRRAVAELDANLPVENLKTLAGQVNENIGLDRMISTLAAAFAVLATLLAAVGLYGVLAFNVSRRTREIGIRLAVGADAADIRALVMKEVGWMVAIGVAVGVPAAVMLGKYAESILFEIKSGDPMVILAGVVLVALVSLAAGYVPARRAMRIAPMSALRWE